MQIQGWRVCIRVVNIISASNPHFTLITKRAKNAMFHGDGCSVLHPIFSSCHFPIEIGKKSLLLLGVANIMSAPEFLYSFYMTDGNSLLQAHCPLCQLRKFHLPQELLVLFYCAIIPFSLFFHLCVMQCCCCTHVYIYILKYIFYYFVPPLNTSLFILLYL